MAKTAATSSNTTKQLGSETPRNIETRKITHHVNFRLVLAMYLPVCLQINLMWNGREERFSVFPFVCFRLILSIEQLFITEDSLLDVVSLIGVLTSKVWSGCQTTQLLLDKKMIAQVFPESDFLRAHIMRMVTGATPSCERAPATTVSLNFCSLYRYCPN